MDFRLTDAEEAFRGDVRRWLDAALPRFFAVEAQRAPRTAAERIAASKAWQRTLYDAGWAGITWPQAHGGRGATIVEQLIFGEECAAAGAPDSINLAVALGLTGPTLMHCGTPQQQAHFLPRILRGDDIWCQGFSEPNAGSDLAGLRTRGVVEGDTIAVTGQKIWTSFAQYADWCILVVRTDPTAGKHGGMTFLLVDMQSPGITVRPLKQINEDEDFSEVFFEDVRVPRSNIIGEMNRGWDIAITCLMHERQTLTFNRQLQSSIALIEMLETARRLRMQGEPVTQHPVLRQKLAAAVIDSHAMRYTAYRNLTKALRGEVPGPEGSIEKLFWSEMYQRQLETAVEIEGPFSQLLEGSPHAIDDGKWPYLMLYSRGRTIAAGSSEIQRNIIAERVLGLPREK